MNRTQSATSLVKAPSTAAQPIYVVRRAAAPRASATPWNDPCWEQTDSLHVRHFHRKSGDHRPDVRVRVIYDETAIYARFHVKDQYVKCVHDKPQSIVSRDSCVECFLQPAVGKGYFNFEMNCGGTLLLYYIEDATRLRPAVFEKFTILPDEALRKIRIEHSLPTLVEQEIEEPIEWWLVLTVPLSLLEQFAGRIGNPAKQIWRGNFFKCGDGTSHPHWASWAPIGEKCIFHQPDRFGWLHFA